MCGRGRGKGEGGGDSRWREGRALQGVAARQKVTRRGTHGRWSGGGSWSGRSRGGGAWRG